MSRKALTSTRCHYCRYSLISTFAAFAGVSIRTLPVRPRLPPTSAVSNYHSPHHRSFTQYPRLQNDVELTNPAEEAANPSELDTAETTPPQKPPPQSESQSIPWYLQVSPPTPPAPTNSLLSRQEIPEVPSDAPSILSPLLTHLSSTLGLDSLTLLDLRSLSPPPALGANLIMILATARSVKHLNVSADRLCRWCRSEFKLRPYADGLLGRNELKLKLRRKARRMKLARSVGNTIDGERREDDGITTGWICVNIGAVDDADATITTINREGEGEGEGWVETEEAEAEYQEGKLSDDGYIGFGSRSTAPRIVVQIFTEEKRAEMDLEGLWDVRASRRARKEERAGDGGIDSRSTVREGFDDGRPMGVLGAS